MNADTMPGGINPEALLDLVFEQMNSDVEMGDVEALYDLLDCIPRAQLVDYLSMTRQDEALEKGLITEQEYTA